VRKFIRSYRAFCWPKVQANHSDIGMARIIHLHDGVVERDATGRRLLYDPALQLLVLGEAVDRQRFGPRFQERDAVFDLLDLKKKRERKQVHQQFSDIILIAQEEMRRLPSVRTVTIGRSGPNISSVMMSESSGGFSRMVGSMLLQLRINQGLWRQAESLDHVNQSHCQWFGAYRVLA
jgi:hypothetical protein